MQIWGKPVLDQKTQILRLTDISLAVESEAAFGLLGTAARAAMPYLQQALADNAVIDLKPFARRRQGQDRRGARRLPQDQRDGVEVDAAVQRPAPHRHRLRFARRLRVIAEAERHGQGGGDGIAADVGCRFLRLTPAAACRGLRLIVDDQRFKLRRQRAAAVAVGRESCSAIPSAS